MMAPDSKKDDSDRIGSKGRILLADDHALVAAAFESQLKPLYEIVGTVADGRALLEAVAELKPDLVLLDISMPGLNGLDAARLLRKSHPQCRLVFLTMNDQADLAAEAMRIGASGYLLKTSGSGELFKAIEEALKGRTYITPHIAEDMVKAMASNSRRDRFKISARQREVLQLLAEGLTMKEVSRKLNISQRTVAFHKYRIMEQLELSSSAELVRFAVREGLVSS